MSKHVNNSPGFALMLSEFGLKIKEEDLTDPPVVERNTIQLH